MRDRCYTSVHPFAVAMACCAAESFARFFAPIRHSLSATPAASASKSDRSEATESFGHPFMAMSTPIVPANATSSNAAHETNVESICDLTFEKSSTPSMRRRLLQPWKSSEADAICEVSSPPISCKFVQP